MLNPFFELDRLRVGLQEKGVDDRIINDIVTRASKQIEELIRDQGQQAVETAVEIGVQKRSPEFINELQFDNLAFEVQTETGQLDFSEPPKPMLPFLLKNAKPMKDGSGAYKVIPVGKPGSKDKVSSSILDVQKKITAERAEAAMSRAKSMAPAGSKINFRTASTKQDPQTQWVKSATEKDFTDDVKDINSQLTATLDAAIYDIIEEYLDMY